MGSASVPLSPRPDTPGPASEGPPGVALVCDDAPNITHFIARVAGRLGIACLEAGSAEAIQQLALAHPTALMFLDLSLGRGDAIQVLSFLKAHKFTGFIVLISGHERTILDHVTDIGRRHGLAMLPPIRKPFAAEPIRQVLYQAGLASGPELAAASPRPEMPAAPLVQPCPFEPTASRRTVADGEFEMCYRPVVGLEDYRAVGIDAYLRVAGAAKALEAGELRDRFTPERAEALARRLVARARSDWERLAEDGINLRFSLRVPCSVLLSGEFCEIVREHWSDDPRWPGFLVEVDDEGRDAGFDVMCEEFIRLRLYKIAFSMSDLGRVADRYESYKSLQPGALTLSHHFVHGCAQDLYKAELCKAGIDLGRKLRAPVNAKGIETAEDLALLRSYGCARGQGNLFSHALSFDNLAAWLRPGTPLHRARAPNSVRGLPVH